MNSRQSRTRNRIRQTHMNYLLRTQKVCQRCGTDEDLTGDHITPISQGGRNVISNLQLLCRKCNGRKGRTEDRLPDMQGRNKDAAQATA